MMTNVSDELDVIVRSRRLHARRFGSASAPLVIGVHGLTGSIAQLEVLAERLGGDHLQFVAIDLRGRGLSEATGPGSYGWENHARDVLAMADTLGFQRFGLVGLSMGGSVAMKAAELDGSRLEAVVLLDVAGRVDPGIGPAIESVIANLEAGPAPLAHIDAVAEDRRCTLSEDPYVRWGHLTMPTLLVRATQELSAGSGHVVPADDRDRFEREVPRSLVVEVDASHLTIATHPDTAAAIGDFLADVRPR
jgi:pimeloyl-ACP methyl ester carboxylesterase